MFRYWDFIVIDIFVVGRHSLSLYFFLNSKYRPVFIYEPGCPFSIFRTSSMKNIIVQKK